MTSTSQANLAPESESDSSQLEAASAEVFVKSAEAFRTIGEAAAELGLKTHVLRFWETRFDNLRPLKRPDGRRYYRPEDMELLRRLQNLLHVQGLTIRGALKVLEDKGPADGADLQPGAAGVEEAPHDEGADDMRVPSETGASVRDLQNAVRDAVARGDFRGPEIEGNSAARERLEGLLADLTSLKSRLDAVRGAA